MKIRSFCFIVYVGVCAALFSSVAAAQTVPAQPTFEIGEASDLLGFIGIERYKRLQNGEYQYTSGGQPIEASSYGLEATHFHDYDSACQVYLLVPGRTAGGSQVVRLFPNAEHQSMVDADIRVGCATELRTGLRQSKLYFSYVHDVTRKLARSGMTLKGADIYSIDVSPFAANVNYTGPVSVRRLTFQPPNRTDTAMNPRLAGSPGMDYGAINNSSAVEMESDQETKLVFTSSREMLANSNSGGPDNFSLFESLILPDGSLGRINKFQYYTTTAAISVFNMRGGIGFSYQDRISDRRHWALHRVFSNGKWTPAVYGNQSGVASHFAAQCATRPGDTTGQHDWLITGMYYSSFNNGLGAIRALPVATLGQNNNDFFDRFAYRPLPLGEAYLTNGFPFYEDLPAWNSTTREVFGKSGIGACGRPGELYMSFTPTCASTRFVSVPGQCIYEMAALGNFHLKIVKRTGYINGQGQAVAVDPRDTSVWKPVINDTAKVLSLAFAQPILTWQQRMGAEPEFNGTTFASRTGEPIAAYGTADTRNTDRGPLECAIASPSGHTQPVVDGDVWRSTIYQNAREVGLLAHNPTMLVRDPTKLARNHPQTLCNKPLEHGDVGWVEIAITSEKTDPTRIDPVIRTGPTEYAAVATSSEIELSLGVVPIDSSPFNGQLDSSFRVFLPSNVPWKSRPIDRRSGMTLINFDSWHALREGEDRHDCGGCHNHKPGEGVAWEGRRAAQPGYQTTDLLNQTPRLSYNRFCQVVETVTNGPKQPNPKWSDIFPGIQRYCSACHAAGQSGAGAWEVSADSYDTWKQLRFTPSRNNQSGRGRTYAVPRMALMSQAFLAARFDDTGYRADGRDNNYYLSRPELEYHISPIHATMGLCSGNHPDGQAAADFVYNLGRVIDTGFHFDPPFANYLPFNYDRYHPSVASAFAPGSGCSGSHPLRVGFWDDSGVLESLQAIGRSASGQTLFNVTRNPSAGLPNGFEVFSEVSQLTQPFDSVEIIATDMAGNRQRYTKYLRELQYECVVAADPRNGQGPGLRPTSTPTPVPSASPTPSGTPGGGGNGGPEGFGVGFTVSPSSPKPGGEVTFTVTTDLSLVGKKCVVVGSNSGTTPGIDLAPNRHLSLNPDSYFTASMNTFIGDLVEKNGAAVCKIEVIVPKGYAFSKRLNHQAGVLDIGSTVYGVSSPRSMSISAPARVVPLGAMGRALDKMTKNIKVMTRKLKSMARATGSLKRKKVILAAKLAQTKISAKAMKRRIADAKRRGMQTFGRIGKKRF